MIKSLTRNLQYMGLIPWRTPIADSDGSLVSIPNDQEPG